MKIVLSRIVSLPPSKKLDFVQFLLPTKLFLCAVELYVTLKSETLESQLKLKFYIVFM